MGAAGQPQRSLLKPVLALILVVVVAGAAFGYASVPTIRDRVDSLIGDLRLRFMPTLEDVIVSADQVTGEGIGENIAHNAVDGIGNTHWLTDETPGPPTLRVDLDRPVYLGAFIFHTGSGTDAEFLQHRRPSVVEVSFPGTGADAMTVNLSNTHEAQSFPIDQRDVSSIVFRILETYGPGQTDELVALRLIEIKERR